MSYEAKVLADSLSPDGVRLTTVQMTFPRFILAEVNTHRVLSRNSASSRAIPVEKRIRMISEDPFVPDAFGKNQKGMQAAENLDEIASHDARVAWNTAALEAVNGALRLSEIGVHKQLANRLLEPFAWHTACITSTEWSNFEHLRVSELAQPEFFKIASMMFEAVRASEPRSINYGEWHLPYVRSDEAWDMKVEGHSGMRLARISAGRSARTSYLTQEGKRDCVEDLRLYENLLSNGHMSPLEHPCRPMTKTEREMFQQKEWIWDGEIEDWCWTGRYTHFLGNVQGWVQLRKLIPGEADIHGYRSQT